MTPTALQRVLVPILFFAVAAGSLVALAIVERERGRDNVVESASVTPAFSPADSGELPERALIRFRLSEAEPRASAEVTRPDGSVIRTLSKPEPVEAGAPNLYAWDGRTDSGRLAPAGLYGVRVILEQLDRAPYLPERTRLLTAGSDRSTSKSVRSAEAGGEPAEASPLEWGALVAAAVAAGLGLVLGTGDRRAARVRAAMFAVALALSLVLVVEDAANARLDALAEPPSLLVAAGLSAALIVGGLGLAFARWPGLLPPLAVAAVPFQIPVEIGGQTSKVFIPVYVVIAGGLLGSALRGDYEPDRRVGGLAWPWARRLRWAAAVFILLYALQSAYTQDFSQAVEEACFFYFPLAALYALLSELRWSSRLLAAVAVTVVAQAAVLAAVGFIEAGARELLYIDPPAVEGGNEVHTYFRVNSLIWDPNFLGRYLVLALLALATAALWTRSQRLIGAAAALGMALLAALLLTFSISSLIALMAGMSVLAAARWGPRWGLVLGSVFVAASVAILAFAGPSPGAGDTGATIDEQASGRGELVRGGLELARERPIAGHGSGGFRYEFGNAYGSAYDEPYSGPRTGKPLTGSHTEPVTVATEQGIIGLAAFSVLLFVAFAMLIANLRATRACAGPQRDARASVRSAAAAAVLAAFVGLCVQSLLQGALLSDGATWAVLSIGAGIAARESA
jgi:putative inorganic carbon (HCO3(-)) transporter